MPTPGDRRFLVVVLLAAVAASALPYLFAARAAGAELVFGGFLLNPLDGNSYLAKMYQGYRGGWLFTLPFTAETGRGAFLFPFYLLLGHLARLLHLPLVWVFHLARLLSALALWLMLAVFLHRVFKGGLFWRFALLASIFGGGLGWVALLFGTFTPDFWVAEAYPFLSAYSNPHFSLSLALLLWLLLPLFADSERPTSNWLMVLAAFVLAFLSPFALVIAGMLYAAMALLDFIAGSRAEQWEKVRLIGNVLLGGLPPLIYQLWVIHTDPLLSGWNAQNLTPSPPVWETLLALGVLLPLALPGVWLSIHQRSRPGLAVACWLGGALLLLYLPWGLQRRFFVGLFIPLVVLAGIALQAWSRNPHRLKFVFAVLLLGLLPTNFVNIAAQILGARSGEPRYYYRTSEAQSYVWIAANLPQDAVILASPDGSLFIPAYTGRKVVYGHPFETIDAQPKQSAVLQFFQGDLAINESPFFQSVDYVYLGPRERLLGSLEPFTSWPVVYRNDQVVIFQVVR